MKLIITNIEDNVCWSNNKISTKVYLSNISYHIVEYLSKSEIKFDYIKFVGNTVTNIFLPNIKKILDEDNEQINFNSKNYENIYKMYNDYNNFGYCILSNDPIFVIPYLPELFININKDDYNDHVKKTSIKILIGCTGCVDLISNIICTTGDIIETKILPNSQLLCGNLKFNSIRNKINTLDKKNIEKLINIIGSLRLILFEKYFNILKDINPEYKDNIYNNNYIYSDQINKYDQDIFYIPILTNKFIDEFNNKSITQITLIGNYIQRETNIIYKKIFDEFKKLYPKLTDIDKFEEFKKNKLKLYGIYQIKSKDLSDGNFYI